VNRSKAVKVRLDVSAVQLDRPLADDARAAGQAGRSWRSGGRIAGGQTLVAHSQACAEACAVPDFMGSAGAGVCTLLVSPKRLSKMAVILKPSTLLYFHRALVKRKYRLPYSPRKRRRPGPKGPLKRTHRRGYRDETTQPALRLPKDCRANIQRIWCRDQ
jgi:hypothetical protein